MSTIFFSVFFLLVKNFSKEPSQRGKKIQHKPSIYDADQAEMHCNIGLSCFEYQAFSSISFTTISGKLCLMLERSPL